VRRIYRDGLNNPEDPDLTLHGHSIGHREGDALVIGTTAIVPQAFIAISSACIWPGRMSLHDDLEITAPKVLTTNLEPHGFFLCY
jgi:hypothetical protein